MLMNNDFNWWFAMMTLCNTSIGLSNIEKNTEQEERQIRIENKIPQKELLANLQPKRKLYLTAAEKRRDLARIEKLEEVV